MKSKHGFKMTPSYSPFSIIEGGRENPNGPVKPYTLSPEELEHYRNMPYKPPTDHNGKPLGKPSRPPGGGGAA